MQRTKIYVTIKCCFYYNCQINYDYVYIVFFIVVYLVNSSKNIGNIKNIYNSIYI